MGFDDDSGEAFIEAVEDFIDRGGLLSPRCGVIVGVSGGADSVALLAVLRELAARPSRQYRLTVAHLDHALRAESAADAAFVAELAAKWQLPCVVERRDVASGARLRGVGIEQAAREARYDFLARAAATTGASCVAVAHHADDNIETALHRIVRGTHLHGLAAMAPCRPLAEGLVLVRPLLCVHRDQVEAFCRGRGLAWRTDATNADTAYRRNFIRHELLPLVRQMNPRADEAIERLILAAADADAVLEQLARAALASAGVGYNAVNCQMLLVQPPVVQTYALRLLMEQTGVPMGAVGASRLAEAAALLSQRDGAVGLGGRFDAVRVAKVLIIQGAASEPQADEVAIPLAPPGSAQLPSGQTVHCRIEPFDAAAFAAHCRNRPGGSEILDAAKLSGSLMIRPRRNGDVFVPLGAPGRASVSNFLTNSKLPARQRKAVRCICDDLGIVYIWPLRIDDRVKVTPATGEVLRIETTPPKTS